VPEIRTESREWVALTAGFPGAERDQSSLSFREGVCEDGVIVDLGQGVERELDLEELEVGVRSIARLMRGAE